MYIHLSDPRYEYGANAMVEMAAGALQMLILFAAPPGSVGDIAIAPRRLVAPVPVLPECHS